MTRRRTWNPWRALRARPHIRFEFDPVAGVAGGGVYGRRGDRAVILIDPSLGRIDRNAVLAHELVHDERGVIDEPELIAIREEVIVDNIVADRLVPLGELLEVVEDLVEMLGAVTAADVAEVFEVPVDVASRALYRLTTDGRGAAA